MNKVILVIGSRGLVGSRLIQLFSNYKDYYVIVVNRNHDKFKGIHKSYSFDISDSDMLKFVIKSHQPEFIIFSAGLTDVDYCEQNPKISEDINLLPIKDIVALKKCFKKLIYFSTDSVFDGLHGNYDENDIPNPINTYASHKLLSENLIQKELVNYTIYRFNVVGYSSQSNSFINWVFKSIKNNKKIAGFNDVYFNPLHPKQIAEVVSNNMFKHQNGLYHLALDEDFTKYDFIKNLFHLINHDSLLLQSVSIDAMHFPAKRPKKTTLESRYLKKGSSKELYKLLIQDYLRMV